MYLMNILNNLCIVMLLVVGFLAVIGNSIESSNNMYGDKDANKEKNSDKGKDSEKESDHIKKFFEDNYQENKDYSEENPLEFVSIQLSNSTQKKEGADDNKYVIIVFDRG